MNIFEFIQAHNITSGATRAPSNPNMPDKDMDHWLVWMRKGRSVSMDVPFSMGKGHGGKAPLTADVLDCMASDACGIDNARTFEDWASEYGYDPDSRKAEALFKICQQQAEQLKAFLGDEAYQTLLYEVERQ